MISWLSYLLFFMASTSHYPLEEAYANLGIDSEEDDGLEIDVNLVHTPPQNFRRALVGRLLGSGNVIFESFRQLMALL